MELNTIIKIWCTPK